jgi:hypothetical protein
MDTTEKERIFIFTNKVEGKCDTYYSDFIINGTKSRARKAFFPAFWSREKVMHKIFEAYDNCLQSGIKPVIRPDGKYRLQGYTSEGIEIEMIITKDGTMKVAHPTMRNMRSCHMQDL